MASNLHHLHHHHRNPNRTGSIVSSNFPASSPNPNTINEERLIDALINKIMAKLSNQADPNLSTIETDDLIRQSCSSLFEMCRHRLPFIIQKLLQELDSPSHPFTSDEQTGLVDHLRTQLFIIKILGYCMSYHWAWHREHAARQSLVNESNQPLVEMDSRSILKPSLTDWTDPPQLEDNLAKQLVATISFFLKEHQRFEDAGAALGPIGSSQSHFDLSRRHAFGSPYPGAPNVFSSLGRESEEKPIVPSLMSEILSQVAKICFFVSASNWPIVLGKIKNRIAYWSGPEEFPDRSETRLLEFCSLNRVRLSSVIRELSAQFAHLKRAAQSDISLALRRSIWNWIETYPNEYANLVRSNGRLDGGPDVLFDVAHGLSENGKKRAYTWPMMAMLLAVCPDIALKIAVGERNRSQVTARKAAFIESLRKNLKAVKMTDVATSCCVDLCKVATFSPKTTIEGPGLRLLALDLVSDLNSRLLDPSKPFTNPEGLVEIALMSEALAALCKLDRHFVDSTLLEKYLSPTSFPPFQIAFIQAFHKLAIELSLSHNDPSEIEDKDPDSKRNWNVRLDELYPLIAAPLRQLFISAVLGSNQINFWMRPNLNTVVSEEHNLKNEIVRALLSLWSQDCKLAFYTVPGKTQSFHTGHSFHEIYSLVASATEVNPNNLEVFTCLTTFLLDNRNPRPLRQSALNLIRSYCQPVRTVARILRSEPQRANIRLEPDVIARLNQTRPIVGIAILKNLLETWAHKDEERDVLQVFKAYLDGLKEAVESSEKPNGQFPFFNESNARDFRTLGYLIQLVIPLGLCTVDQYNLALLLRCSKELISILEKYPTVLRIFGFESTISASQLASTLQGLPDDGKGLGGRVAQAKRARLVIRTFSPNSQLIFYLWDEALRRWKLLSGLVGHRPFEDLPGDAVIQDPVSSPDGISGDGVLDNTSAWISISGLLTSTASFYEPNQVKQLAQPLENYLPAGLLPDRFYVTPDRAKNMDRYIQEMVDLLVADDLKMREGVKDALGMELNSSLFPILLKHLKSIVAHFFENDQPKPQSPFTHFIEQTISMLRLFFERLNDPLGDQAPERVGELLIDFARYTNRLGHTGSENLNISTRIKYKLAQLCEIIINLRDKVGLSTNIIFKNCMIDYFLAWSASVNMVSCVSTEEASRQRANRDLSMACLKALSAFYDGLKLQSRHHLARKLSNPKTIFARVFSRHYDYLTFLLAELTKIEASNIAVRSRRVKMATGASVTGNLSAREQGAALQRELSSITRELAELSLFREQTISCLVNLMASNMNPGYKHFVNMLHYPEIRIRQSNIQILKDVIKEGGQMLPKLAKPSRHSGLDTVIDMICRPDLTLALAMCKICGSSDFEELTDVILNVFDYRKGTIKFLKASIEREVADTDHESTVFRGNSLTTRLLTVFARAQGYDYLRNTLANLLLGLSNKPSEFSMDFDPHRASAEDDEAARNLEQVTEAFLNVIAVSWKKLPGSIRKICHHIATTVQEKYPESVFTAIGGFIFLRFINPAIVSPEVIDLDLPNDNREIRRSLVMITKVLQALSNNIRFGSREPAIKSLNPFMAKNIYPMTRFLKDISSIDDVILVDEEQDEVDDLVPIPLDAADRYVLHRFMFDNMEKLGAELKATNPTAFRHWHDGTERLSPNLGSEIWHELQKVLLELGPPTANDPDLPISQMEGPEYYNFLAKNELMRAPDPRIWQSMFFEVPRSRMQPSLTFVFLVGRLKTDSCDLESFYLHIFQALESVEGPFSLFFDCTGFSITNEISIPWFRQLLEHSPPGLSPNISNIWVYNSNATFRRYIRKLSPTEKPERKWTGLIKAVSTLDELGNCLPGYEQVLPASSWNMFHDKRVVISHVTHLQQFQIQIPVVFHIGSSTLIIRSAKKLELLNDTKCTLNDVIRLSDIEEMQRLPPSSVHSDPGFIIKLHSSNATLKFVSVNTDRIIENLSTMQAELIAISPNLGFRTRAPTPSTVYGALFNGAILNLCSSDSLIRMTALSFLQSLTKTLKIDKMSDVMACQGGYIPRIGLAFISEISDRLARAVPSATFSFLDEFFITLPTVPASEISVYANTVKPWLQNLSGCLICPREEYETARFRAKGILRRLIELTLSQQDLQGILHCRIWPSLARQEPLLSLIIEELAMSAIISASSSTRFNEVCEIALSANCIGLQGKLLHRLRRAIARTTVLPVSSITESPEWPELAALVRIEMSISFYAHLQAQLYLPDILHVVTMLVGTGSAGQRSAVYAIVVNTLSCLCTSHEAGSEDSPLDSILKRLGQPASQALFGLYPSDIALRYPEDDFSLREAVSSNSLESLVQILIEAVNVASSSLDTVNRWRSRWASLVTSTCFQANPALQPRAFLVLGHLLTEEVDDDLLFQVLSALKPALGSPAGIDRALSTSITSCAAKVLAGVSLNSPYRSASFWTGVSLLQLEDPAVYASALKLSRSSVQEFCRPGALGGRKLSHFLLDSRDEGAVEVMLRMDELSGLRFDNAEGGETPDGAVYFGFALAGLMIKGLRHAQIAQDAEEFLELLLSQAAKSSSASQTGNRILGPESLPYFTVLLPIAARSGKLGNLFNLAEIDRNGLDSNGLLSSYGFIIEQLGMFDHETALLVVALFTSMILTASDEAELLFLYSLLAELVQRDTIPHIMMLVQNELSSRIQEIMRTSDNSLLLQACQTVMFPQNSRLVGSTFLNRLVDGLESTDFLTILSQLGFSGLITRNSFNEGNNEILDEGSLVGVKDYDMKVSKLCVQLVSQSFSS
ncbi:hypothetical protein BY996DRAFT_4641287 [Phakopsora pachyrhizi]|uniref:Ras-GAP domain-containing protein n=1 Tax=Phakopsora pachyrhizi TaxID=170000 RepID=A0AAV0AS22_PHAPC|nr:hypothetical protein BY996DRAFT_4653897 [Phakopsora pachyrhizi]KAI8451271.1 hypothetical protein BY996DRAFT_4641287 [Phakopsora pachyrhizi]CAH7670866.1 hypothetical protein PPACK8108_LOCUS5610 [Phakopsora pachyrhizi]